MALSEEEKQKRLSDFLGNKQPEKPDEYDPENDPWTDEAILAVAKKILKRLGLDGKYL